MKISRANRIKINLVIISTSLIVWLVLLFNTGQGIAHCHVSDSGPSAASFRMLLQMNPISSLLMGWGLMVVAMMLPKLIIPVQQIYASSFKRHRFALAMVFVLGYIAVWMVVGFFMVLAILGVHLLLPNSYLPAIALGIIAIVWQFSPVKQRCLNRGHDHKVLAAFGRAAYSDALLFGIIHGVWCVGAGWALMLLPMLLPQGHNLAMVLVTFIMLSEHLEHPQQPRWCINLRGKLFRIIIARTQMKIKQVLA